MVIRKWRLSLYFSLFLLISRTVSSEILLEDDFSGDLSENWVLFGDPLPVICDSTGNPAPSFDNNGDTMFSSGAVSRNSFDYAEGLTLECDMYITSNERGAWIGATLALGFIEEGEYNVDGIPSQEIMFTYIYCGEAEWGRPHLQGVLATMIYTPDGERDNIHRNHLNDYLDSWHRYRIVLEPDMTVSFFVDSTLIHESTLEIPLGQGQMSIMIGERSSSWGKVYHDNLLLARP
jgi:hypothetical protein